MASGKQQSLHAACIMLVSCLYDEINEQNVMAQRPPTKVEEFSIPSQGLGAYG
jgi:hypothetical protein